MKRGLARSFIAVLESDEIDMCQSARAICVDGSGGNRSRTSMCRALTSLFVLLAWAAVASFAGAQDNAHVFNNGQIQTAVQTLRAQLARADRAGPGLAEERLDAVTFVAMRIKSGRAEVHKTSDDVFVVLSGEATLVTGGTVVNPSGTDEIRGDSISGGTSAKLEKGEVVHVPQAVPHQLLLPGNETFTYMLIKIPR